MSVLTAKIAAYCVGLIFLLGAPVNASLRVIHHQLSVAIDPATQTLKVTDTIDLKGSRIAEFLLHPGMNPRITSAGAELTKTGHRSGAVPLDVYRVVVNNAESRFTLSYSGRIDHDFQSRTESPGREQKLLAGTISEQGVFLDGSVAWYPVLDNVLQTFDLSVALPAGWTAVSQGAGPTPAGNDIRWQARQPQDDIYLIAGRYHVYRDGDSDIEAQVFLRDADESLAQKYLAATREYIQLYEDLIGAYPYAKFALVENFWETGYGMPSFTLLGSRVLRLPFILHSSYPHEILHNWWGNGVLVDYPHGNWSEGLTAYLADHLLKEQSGQGIQHRRSSLQRFASFVRKENDFPLLQFRSRHSGSSQAVGYDKAMMFFHMLRRKLGDAVFIDGLRRFYKHNLFKITGYAELQDAFEQASEQDLNGFFKQWLERKAAPSLQLQNIRDVRLVLGHRLELQLGQIQSSPAFDLDIPLHIYLQGEDEPLQHNLAMNQRNQQFSIDLPARPQRVEIDPWFDLFRQLDPSEAPPTLSSLFGHSQALFVLPGKASAKMLAGYRAMAEQWARGYDHASIKSDHELDALPDNQHVWLLGWNNRFTPAYLEQFDDQQFASDGGNISVTGEALDRQQHSLVLTRRSETNQVQGWVASTRVEALSGLTRKLPHYGKYSYLAFSGDRPSIQLKGQWPVNESSMKKILHDSATSKAAIQPQPLWPVPN